MKPTIPHLLFDTLLAEEGLKNDRNLAKELDVGPPYVSKVRHGVLLVNDTLRVAIMRKFKWPLKRLDEMERVMATKPAAEL